MRHRYPFEALQWLRKKRVEREALEVSERTVRTERARITEESARVARETAQQRVADTAARERARLADGSVRAGDLARIGEWERGARAEVTARATQEAHASEAHRTELAAELVARRALAVAHSKADVIDTHRSEWQRERSAAEEQAAEEAAVEQWTAKRYPPRG